MTITHNRATALIIEQIGMAVDAGIDLGLNRLLSASAEHPRATGTAKDHRRRCLLVEVG